MTVKYFATIRDLTRETERRIDGRPGDLRELHTQLAERYGRPFRHAVFDGDDLHREIIVFVNGRNVRHLRLLEEPLKSGASKGQVSRLGDMVPEYYAARGYDENGVPTKAKLKELSLKA